MRDSVAKGLPRQQPREARPARTSGSSVHFHLRGDRLTGRLVVPDGSGTRPPVVVLPPDWPAAMPPAAATATTALAAAGLATFSYRPSSRLRNRLRPNDLVLALRAAVARLRGEPGVDGDRTGVLGVGPIAGGVALVAAADDPWVRAVCAHDPAMDGESWMKERARLDDERWDSLVAETMGRLRARTVGGTDAETVPIAGLAPDGEIDLTAFDHLLRFRPGQHASRIPPGRLRVTRSGGTTDRHTEDMVEQSCRWFLGALRSEDYAVLHETA